MFKASPQWARIRMIKCFSIFYTEHATGIPSPPNFGKCTLFALPDEFTCAIKLINMNICAYTILFFIK